MLLSRERPSCHTPSSGRLAGGCTPSIGEAPRQRMRLTSPADALRLHGGSAEAEAEAEAVGRADASAATNVRGTDGEWTANFRLGPEMRPRLTRLPSRLSTGPVSGAPSAIKKRPLPLAAVLAHAEGSSSTEVVLELFTVKRRRRSPCTSLPHGESETDEHESRAVQPESQRELRLCGEGRPSASTPSSRSKGRTPTSQDSVLL